MLEKRRHLLIGAAVAVASAASGIALWRATLPRAKDAARLRSIALPDPVSGKTYTLADWSGLVLVVNFWATWCEPCREEMPILVRAQAEWGAKGVQVVGIGVDDAAKIREFAKTYSITFPLAQVGPEIIEITRDLGNTAGGLPYTVVLGRQGAVSATHLGALNRAQIDALLRSALASSS